MSAGVGGMNTGAFSTFAAARPGAVLAGVLLALVALAAFLAPLIAPQDPAPEQIDAFFAAHSGATGRTLEAIETLLTSR